MAAQKDVCLTIQDYQSVAITNSSQSPWGQILFISMLLP